MNIIFNEMFKDYQEWIQEPENYISVIFLIYFGTILIAYI